MLPCRHIIPLLLLFGDFLTFSGCDEIGSDIMGKVRYLRRSNAPVIRRLVGKSLRECVVECGLRSSCVGLNYQRFAKMCELLGATSLPFEDGQSKGWIHILMDDIMSMVIMKQHCGNRENCPPGQTCYKNGSNYLCGIKECLEPVGISDDYKPNSGFMLHVNATIMMTSNVNRPYYIRCCADGNWADRCPATPVSTLLPSTTAMTSTTPISNSPSNSTTRPSSTTTAITTQASTLPPSTTPVASTTPMLTSPLTTTTNVISITINEYDWYTLESETRKRQLASVKDIQLNWKNAMAFCESNGGYLAHVNTIDEREKINDWLLLMAPVNVLGMSSSSPSDVSDEFWVGGMYYLESNEWLWTTSFGKGGRIDIAWGDEKPTTDLDKSCVNLYKDSQNGDIYSLRNSYCRMERNFICERDLVDVTLSNDDWFIFNSAIETREMTYIENPTLSWEKAQEVCSRNGASLAHVYNTDERLSLQILSTKPDDKLWVGAKYNSTVEKWYWWSNSPNNDRYVDSALWADSESRMISYCLHLSQFPVGDLYALRDSNCTENNGFLCQRKINVKITNDSWFPLQNGNTELKEIAFVNSPSLNWYQSKEVCEQNDGVLLQINSNSDLKLIRNEFQGNGIQTNEEMWIGGKTDGNSNEWFWWSNNDKTYIDWSALSLSAFDSDTEACIVLTNPNVKMTHTDCNTLHHFLCQREIVFKIADGDWFLVNGRKMAHVSKETSWEGAMDICEGNDGILASIYDKTDIVAIQTEFNMKGISFSQQIWIGGRFSESQGEWFWQENNMQIEESLWLSGVGRFPNQYPDDACVQLFAENIQNDLCNENYSFMCQKDDTPPGM